VSGAAPGTALAEVRARVRRTLRERRLVAPGARVLVACSGGPDSTALLVVLRSLAPEFALGLEVATVDHGLRPGSEEDVEIVRAQAAALGLPVHAIALPTAGWGRRTRDGRVRDLQAKARDARYEALRACAASRGAAAIAVGHTRDDQAETVLLRLLRGAGLRGLAGVAPRRADGVVRPLLDCPRSEVHAVARESGLPIAADPSNEDRRFARVRLRQDVVPALLAEDPAALVHLARLADDARAARSALEAAAARLGARARGAGGEVALAALRAAPSAVRCAALGRLVREAGAPPVSRAQLVALEQAVLQGRGRVLLGGGLVAEAGRAHLHFVRGGRRAGRRAPDTLGAPDASRAGPEPAPTASRRGSG
jgi:tRNA(Ile)-lysidine synthase